MKNITKDKLYLSKDYIKGVLLLGLQEGAFVDLIDEEGMVEGGSNDWFEICFYVAEKCHIVNEDDDTWEWMTRERNKNDEKIFGNFISIIMETLPEIGITLI